MSTALSSDIQLVRRWVRDYPRLDALTASITSSATSVGVGSASSYSVNWAVQVDQEVMRVTAVSADGVTVVRGDRGTTAASHASAATVLMRPDFFDVEIIDHLNAGIDACYPTLYKEIVDTSISTTAQTYEYNLPSLATGATVVDYLVSVEQKEPGDLAYRQIRSWGVQRGSTPILKLQQVPPTGTVLRLRGYGQFPHRTALSDTLDSQWPYNAQQLPALFAASNLLASGEAGRVRVDTLATDSREQANRVGSSSAQSTALLQRFQLGLRQAEMPPLPPNVYSVW